MKLLIDAGNSFIKYQAVGVGRSEVAQVSTKAYQEFLSGVLDGCRHCEAIIVSSVLSDQFRSWLQQGAQSRGLPQPRFVKTLPECAGISVAYSDPSKLGVDRFLAMIAAFDNMQSAVIVVDIGTAITIDAIDGQGKHLGGVIIPGWDQMARCLGAVTERVGIQPGSVKLWGQNTGDAVTSGCYYASLAGMQKVTDLMSIEMGGNPSIVLTGGGAHEFYNELSGDVHVFEDLVLKGLEIMADKV